MTGPQPPVTSGAHRFKEPPERTSTLAPKINQPIAVQTMMPPMAKSRVRVMIGPPFFCGVSVSLLVTRGFVWQAGPGGAPAVFRRGSISCGLLFRLRFLVEKFGARTLLFAKLLMQLNGARAAVGFVAVQALDIAFESLDFVSNRDPQLPVDPVHQQIGLRQLDSDLPRDRFEWRFLRGVR